MSYRHLAGLLAGLALTAITADAAAQNAPQAAPTGDAAQGRKIYLLNGCDNCHGSVGQGGGPGPTLARTSLSFGGYVRLVRQPVGRMPAFAPPLMSDQDLANTYAYLRTLPGPRTGKDMPAILRR
jgi:mono/diheme cytochrome c family protein